MAKKQRSKLLKQLSLALALATAITAVPAMPAQAYVEYHQTAVEKKLAEKKAKEEAKEDAKDEKERQEEEYEESPWKRDAIYVKEDDALYKKFYHTVAVDGMKYAVANDGHAIKYIGVEKGVTEGILHLSVTIEGFKYDLYGRSLSRMEEDMAYHTQEIYGKAVVPETVPAKSVKKLRMMYDGSPGWAIRSRYPNCDHIILDGDCSVDAQTLLHYDYFSNEVRYVEVGERFDKENLKLDEIEPYVYMKVAYNSRGFLEKDLIADYTQEGRKLDAIISKKGDAVYQWCKLYNVPFIDRETGEYYPFIAAPNATYVPIEYNQNIPKKILAQLKKKEDGGSHKGMRTGLYMDEDSKVCRFHKLSRELEGKIKGVAERDEYRSKKTDQLVSVTFPAYSEYLKHYYDIEAQLVYNGKTHTITARKNAMIINFSKIERQLKKTGKKSFKMRFRFNTKHDGKIYNGKWSIWGRIDVIK